jgi:excisionase family DNA binding protein
MADQRCAHFDNVQRSEYRSPSKRAACPCVNVIEGLSDLWSDMTNDLPAYLESLNRTLNANEVAGLLGVRRDTIYVFAKHGGLPSINIGRTKRQLRFDPGELAEWVRKRQSSVGPLPRS